MAVVVRGDDRSRVTARDLRHIKGSAAKALRTGGPQDVIRMVTVRRQISAQNWGMICPTFVFAITMENHGPLHLDPLRLETTEEFYSFSPPDGCDELGTYLRHLHNADGMLHLLHTALQRAAFPASLCFYGDHVPIMPSAYKVLTEPAGIVPYLCWSNQYARNVIPRNRERGEGTMGMGGLERPLAVHDLALTWLESVKLAVRDSQDISFR